MMYCPHPAQKTRPEGLGFDGRNQPGQALNLSRNDYCINKIQ